MHVMDLEDSCPPPATFYDAESYTPDQSVGLLLRQVLSSIIHEADRRLVEHDLTHAQWLPLFRLIRGQETTVAGLARDLGVDPASVTRLLDRLEAKGLVVRERSREDRRVVHLVLTEAGRTLGEQVPPVLAGVLNAHLAGFSTDEWTQLMTLLRRMRSNGEALRADALAKKEPT